MKPVYSVRYGARTLAISLGADLIALRDNEPLADEKAAIRAALAHPTGTPPLAEIVRSGERVAVIVNDVTRLARTELMLPAVVETLNRAGIPDPDILVVFAVGNHRRQTEDERRRIIGDEMFRRLPMLEHDCTDEGNLKYLGTTSYGNRIEINRRVWECDRIILTGEILFHLIAGFSGGRKSLIPGVAGYRTIQFNHRMLMEPGCRQGVLEGNPCHEDMLEGCRMVDPDFILNLVLNPQGKLLHVAAGHYEEAHRDGCRAAARLLSTEAGEPYDLVVASSGGAPLDIDLRQAHKGMENASLALKPGGTLFYFAECADGTGSPKLEDYVNRYEGVAETEKALREQFYVGAHKAWWVRRMGAEFDVRLVSSFDPAFVRRCGLTPVALEEYEEALRDAASKARRIAVMPNASFTVPNIRCGAAC